MKTQAASLRDPLSRALALLLIGAPLAGACADISDQAQRVARNASAQAAWCSTPKRRLAALP